MGGSMDFVGEPKITRFEWENDASVFVPPDEPDADKWPHGFHAFQAHSYVAKVIFSDGSTVVVGMPRGAAEHPTEYWADAAALKATELRKLGFSAGFAGGA